MAPDLIKARAIVKATRAPSIHQRCNCRVEIGVSGRAEIEAYIAAFAE